MVFLYMCHQFESEVVDLLYIRVQGYNSMGISKGL